MSSCCVRAQRYYAQCYGTDRPSRAGTPVSTGAASPDLSAACAVGFPTAEPEPARGGTRDGVAIASLRAGAAVSATNLAELALAAPLPLPPPLVGSFLYLALASRRYGSGMQSGKTRCPTTRMSSPTPAPQHEPPRKPSTAPPTSAAMTAAVLPLSPPAQVVAPPAGSADDCRSIALLPLDEMSILCAIQAAWLCVSLELVLASAVAGHSAGSKNQDLSSHPPSLWQRGPPLPPSRHWLEAAHHPQPAAPSYRPLARKLSAMLVQSLHEVAL
jgi:hypothetical protein